MDLNTLRPKLAAAGQEGVLRFANELDDAGRAKLGKQLGALDPAQMSKLADEYVRNKPLIELPKRIEPVTMYPRVPQTEEHKKLYKDAEARGRQLLKEGKVAA